MERSLSDPSSTGSSGATAWESIDEFTIRMDELAQEIPDRDFQKMRNLCKKKIPDKKREEWKDPQDMLTSLTEYGLFSLNDRKFVIELLRYAGRYDLADTVKRWPVKSSSVSRSTSVCQDVIMEELEKELRFHYNKLQHLQPIPWMKRVTVDLGKTYSSLQLIDREMRHEMRRVGMDDNKILGEIVAKNTERGYIELDKLFIPSNEDEIPKRILMEGEAGIGKTTVCRKLAYDWRTGKKYIREMFAAVLLLDMKRFKGSLKLSLANQGLVSKAIDLDQLWQYIESHSEDFLWIIDGLDELNPGSKEEIVELIKGDTFRSSTVLTTARICQWETVVEFDEVLFDREIINVGFHFELAKSFIESYFKSKSAVFDYMPFIEVLSKDSQLKDLSRNPLMCIFLCFLWEDDAFTKLCFEREYIDSYKLLIAMRRWLCKRYVESHKKEISQKIFDERINIIRELAFIGLEQSKQQFGIDEINEMFPAADIQDDDVIFNIGMLAKEMSVTNIEVQHISYAFPHKLMQLPSTKRQEHYTKLIETPSLHPVLLYGTMLLKHEGREEELTHFYTDLTQHVSNIQGDWFAVTDPIFTDPVGVLAFQCLSTSGQPEQLANSLADELQKRKVTQVHLRPYESVSLSSAYSKGLLYIVSETKYKDFMQKLVIDDIDGFPVWFGEIITKIKPSLGEKIVQTFSV